jgi:hypothetical protein
MLVGPVEILAEDVIARRGRILLPGQRAGDEVPAWSAD